VARTETDARTRLAGATGVTVALVGATALVAVLEAGLNLDNASSVYLVAVAVVAIRWGTLPAIVTALGGFLVYNLLFVEPRNTFAVAAPEELLNLLLLLFVGVVIGRLAGNQRDRERVAQRREREARAQFAITRELATAHRLPRAMQAVLERIALETRFRRIWIGLGPTVTQERVAADTAAGEPMPAIGTHAVLRRDREEGAAVWTRINPSRGARDVAEGLYRVELRADEASYGSLWCRRDRADGDPRLEETRLVAAAADQLAQAVRRDRLATRAADLEIERRSDELRSALLDSVSHDLRTPLASIRAAAGGLADPAIEPDPEEVRSTARTIDQEAERLNRLVGTLLDMSRIQAGALVAEIDVIPLTELVEPAVARMRSQLADHSITIDLPPDLPSVRADATLLSQALSNLLENAARYAPPGSPIAIRAASRPERGDVTLVVEDGGAGVPPEALPHLFERFYRVPRAGAGGVRRGFGLGLSVVEGLVVAMGGTVRADQSPLGGLAITLELPADTGRS
jgi:two-component system, OmpR family, sensor histidine kinase KdpD